MPVGFSAHSSGMRNPALPSPPFSAETGRPRSFFYDAESGAPVCRKRKSGTKHGQYCKISRLFPTLALSKSGSGRRNSSLSAGCASSPFSFLFQYFKTFSVRVSEQPRPAPRQARQGGRIKRTVPVSEPQRGIFQSFSPDGSAQDPFGRIALIKASGSICWITSVTRFTSDLATTE